MLTLGEGTSPSWPRTLNCMGTEEENLSCGWVILAACEESTLTDGRDKWFRQKSLTTKYRSACKDQDGSEEKCPDVHAVDGCSSHAFAAEHPSSSGSSHDMTAAHMQPGPGRQVMAHRARCCASDAKSSVKPTPQLAEAGCIWGCWQRRSASTAWGQTSCFERGCCMSWMLIVHCCT